MADTIDTPAISKPSQVLPGLTNKQSKFVEAYKQLNNGPQAAISAGYSAKSASVEANRLLKNPKIITELDEWRKHRIRTFSKNDFITNALTDYGELDVTEPNKPRFLQLAGQAAGHVGANGTSSITNNTQINITQNEIKSMSIDDKWNALRSALNMP